MSTPLYKYLKAAGTTKYVFPGAQEDINSSQQNPNYKVTFDKVVFLNIPRQDLANGILDFESSFQQSPSSQIPSTKPSYQGYGDEIIESLRNYVANHETTIRETRVNQNQYFYDNNLLKTTSEKIFWKWCKKLNIIDFEPAVPVEDYFDNLVDFNNQNGPGGNTDYFREYLWKEREVLNLNLLSASDNGPDATIVYTSQTNYKVGDFIKITGTDDPALDYDEILDAPYHEVTTVTTTTTLNDTVIIATTGVVTTTYTSPLPISNLNYHTLIQYIGEVQSVQNVQSSNRNYTQALTFVPEHEGATPTKLFRIHSDKNYRPGLIYPILPIQKQPEIVGAENFNNPIITNPENYPGDQYGHFDAVDYTYRTQSGDELRRSGNYYGISNGVTNVAPSLLYPDFDGANLDGLNVDFDPLHYSKMNIPGIEADNFNEFNSLRINNLPPKDFEFNAILWYYTVEDTTVEDGIVDRNLYGIEILENPNEEPVPYVDAVYMPRIPVYKKLTTTDEQDGTSYQFSLNLDILIDNDNLETTYDPNIIYDIYSFDLYNEAMRRLAETNDKFLEIISEFSTLRTEHHNILSLIYSQTQLSQINLRLQNLEDLLQIYSTLQIGASDSIVPVVDDSVSPPLVRLNSIDPAYGNIYTQNTSSMFNGSNGTIIQYNLTKPQGKSFASIINNDDQNIPVTSLPSNLKVLISDDLDFKQKVDFFFVANEATLNKKVDIYMNVFNSITNSVSEELLIGNIDLPVDLYPSLTENRSQTWSTFESIKPVDIMIQKISTDYLLEIYFDRKIFFNVDEQIVLNNFVINTTSGTITTFVDLEETNISAQYVVKQIDLTNNSLRIDLTGNANIEALEALVGSGVSIFDRLISSADIKLNTGKKITITRVNNSDSSLIEDRYLIEQSKI